MKNALMMMALAAMGLSMLAWWNVCHAEDVISIYIAPDDEPMRLTSCELDGVRFPPRDGRCYAADAPRSNVAVIGQPQTMATPIIPPFPLQMGVLHYRCHRTSGGATIIEPIESTVPNGDTAIPIIFNCINCECGEEK